MLYLVATPIGHLKDITLRAIEVLQEVDTIACEDTRVSLKLLNHYGISKPLLSYHEHNAAGMLPRLLGFLKEGKKVAYITDGGMPLISDPGFKLVAACQKENIPHTVIPGASAPLMALCLSGLSSARFTFCGFLPPKKGARQTELEGLRNLPTSLIFFESPKRLPAFLRDAREVLGDRQGAVCREMTKLFENVQRGPLSSLEEHYTATPARGEIVVVIEGATERAAPSEEEIIKHLQKALESYSLKEAASLVAKALGVPKREVYQHALILKSKTPGLP